MISGNNIICKILTYWVFFEGNLVNEKEMTGREIASLQTDACMYADGVQWRVSNERVFVGWRGCKAAKAAEGSWQKAI